MGASSESGLPDYESSVGAPPAYEEEAQPATLTLNSDTISSNGTPVYTISRSLTTVQQQSSSIRLERIESIAPEKPDSSASPDTSNNLIFYLVHPVNARYQKDKPPYYATSSQSGLGNIVFDIQKKTMSKPEYKVLLNQGRTASSDPLFADNPTTILTAKFGLMGGKLSWIDSNGRTVAREEQTSDKKQQLNITTSLKVELRDALVAAWCLKVWSDVAESREAKKDGEWIYSFDILFTEPY